MQIATFFWLLQSLALYWCFSAKNCCEINGKAVIKFHCKELDNAVSSSYTFISSPVVLLGQMVWSFCMKTQKRGCKKLTRTFDEILKRPTEQSAALIQEYFQMFPILSQNKNTSYLLSVPLMFHRCGRVNPRTKQSSIRHMGHTIAKYEYKPMCCGITVGGILAFTEAQFVAVSTL